MRLYLQCIIHVIAFFEPEPELPQTIIMNKLFEIATIFGVLRHQFLVM